MGPNISIFQKVWEWLCLVWKMLGYLGGVFLSYLDPPNSHSKKSEFGVNIIYFSPKFGPKFGVFVANRFSSLRNADPCSSSPPRSL